jgi:hypothetical protein
MILLLVLLFVGALVFILMYLMQFYIELDGKKEKLIKDGLIKELMTKATADPDPNSFIIDTDTQTITMGKIVIRKHWADMFWFPYEVTNEGGQYRWDKMTVGCITRFSKDYYLVSKLLEKSKTSIEKTQRQKLNLNK